MRITITAMLLMLAFSTHSEAAKVYKWVDSKGVTHYSAQPPRDKPSETVNVRTGESRSAKKEKNAETDDATETDSTSESGQSPSQPATTSVPAPSLKDPVRCEESRKTEEVLKSREQLRIQDEKTGEYRYASKTEMANWRRLSTEDIERFCP